MHDLSHFRADFDQIAQRLSTRGAVAGLDTFRELDLKRRAALTETEGLKSRVNADSAAIGKLKREGADTSTQQENVRAMKTQIAALDEQVSTLEEQFRDLRRWILLLLLLHALGQRHHGNLNLLRLAGLATFDRCHCDGQRPSRRRWRGLLLRRARPDGFIEQRRSSLAPAPRRHDRKAQGGDHEHRRGAQPRHSRVR